MLVKYRRLAAVVALLAVLSVALSGCGGAIGTALQIAGVSALVPDSWAENSRVVKIIADIVSGSSLREVIAHIIRPDNSTIAVVMTRTDDGQYEGQFTVPEDVPQTETYTAVVTAEDNLGNQATSEPVEVDVPPTDETATTGQ